MVHDLSGSGPGDGGLALRPATAEDVPRLVTWERQADNAAWVTAWEEARHLAALKDPDCATWLIDVGGRSIGFVLLAGLSNPHGAIEFRRIVIAEKGRGHGRAAVEAVARHAFDTLGAHRLWLDVFEDNARARHLYRACGFQEEGVLRECVRGAEGYRSLMIMSLLAPEYRSDNPG